jgi:hypothetical protein
MGEEPRIMTRRVRGATELSVSQHRRCELSVEERYRTVELFEEGLPDQPWWAMTAIGTALVVLGAVFIVGAQDQPSSGLDDQGRRNNPRGDQYWAGGALLAIGGGVFLPMTPWPRDHDVVRGERIRRRTEVVGCGATPYVGPVFIARGLESTTTLTDARGRARIDDAMLPASSGAVTITAPEIGAEVEVPSSEPQGKEEPRARAGSGH